MIIIPPKKKIYMVKIYFIIFLQKIFSHKKVLKINIFTQPLYSDGFNMSLW
jgi:hypothetical protein